jgi:molybdopterin synthase catalytic subunit
MRRQIAVQAENFDAGAEMARLAADGVGGIASFVGVVRAADGVVAMTLEHYPGMTERAMEAIAAQAQARWPLAALTLIHRVGRLRAGENIVFVGAASAHRAAALAAVAFMIDWLKTAAPFWKAEEFEDGRTEWVSAKGEDDAAAAAWG